MKLTDLNPEWVHPDIFCFDCPCCKKMRLSVKRIPMSTSEQCEVFYERYKGEYNGQIVPCRQDQAWNISSDDFNTMTVTPSLDASASGHWHGFITKGEIV